MTTNFLLVSVVGDGLETGIVTSYLNFYLIHCVIIFFYYLCFAEAMAVHRMCVAICFWCLYFFVRSSKSEPEFIVNDSFVDKHVMVNDMAVGDIPFGLILEEFMKVQDKADFINKKLKKNKREVHTFIVTPNLNETKEDLIKAFLMSEKMVDERNINFTSTKVIEIGKLRNVSVMNFNITFKKDIRRYEAKKGTCIYSNKGTFGLGAMNTSQTEYIINHLFMVKLHEFVMCTKDPPPPTPPPPPHVCLQKMEENNSPKEQEMSKKKKN